MSVSVIPRSYEKTTPIDQLLPLVEAGDWDARALYASKLILGNGVEVDTAAGIPMLYEAHEAGAVRATAELAFRLADQDGPIPQDFEKAEDYAALAIERGNHFGWAARLYIAHAQSDYKGIFEAGRKFLSLAEPHERNPDMVYTVGWCAEHLALNDEALAYYGEAAEREHPAAAINLALLIWREKLDLPEDRILAFLRSAAGVPAGAALFADRVFKAHRQDDPSDRELQAEAVSYLIEIPEEDHYQSTYDMLAYAHAKGLGVAKNEREATRLYGLAANCETADAGGPTTNRAGWVNVIYAGRLSEGLGTEADVSAAIAAFECAVEIIKENQDAQLLGDLAVRASKLAQENIDPALRKRLLAIFKEAALSGDAGAMVTYAKELAGQTGKFDKARPWFVNALAAGDQLAGSVAANTLMSLDQKAEAYAFARMAADLGAELSPALSGLDPNARDAGLLFLRGKTASTLYEELKKAVALSAEKYGFHEESEEG